MCFWGVDYWRVATHQASQRLDIDLLVVDNIDELKNFKAPAALRRGHKPLPDSVDVSLSCYAGNGQQKYGMNLGVALLKPSRETLEKMLDVVKSRDRTHQATNGPEQDFLILAFDFSSWFSLILIPILFIKALKKKNKPAKQLWYQQQHDMWSAYMFEYVQNVATLTFKDTMVQGLEHLRFEVQLSTSSVGLFIGTRWSWCRSPAAEDRKCEGLSLQWEGAKVDKSVSRSKNV